jgi:outer membrane scaffolding protein for murein synthesis (MipA/OmpV family)
LAAHAGLGELVGSAARHSPLTERDLQPSAFLGLTYRF